MSRRFVNLRWAGLRLVAVEQAALTVPRCDRRPRLGGPAGGLAGEVIWAIARM
jgi:hypothetical protein